MTPSTSFRIYQLDAFTDLLYTGNPAAVVPLTDQNEWLPDDRMQAIAAENNLAETAFYIRTETGYHIRWFTPTVEVDLCGHATLATGYVVFFLEEKPEEAKITFDSKSGPLTVCRDSDGWLVLDFPADVLHKAAVQPPALSAGLRGPKPLEIHKGKTDFMVVYATQADVEALAPDFRELVTVPARGIIVTAPGIDVDFVSRFFAPQSGIDEDPVTGSAHTTLIPYWADKLAKTDLTARQLSARGGYLRCKLHSDGTRVDIGGQVQLYLKGELANHV
ncbi:PhzF family phenazine biosynthesis protein [Fibrella forsythiae]|uniref:PhzF family phenazine biosynthesis protein n=1 Tax=Fibrella forsythiae TaxID=2817061 RepID=A0ABS3JHN2_9BACT|nr:PhzF family phenazine biosynthesis protein [Fibrella forsythiae]MBO0948913.1 PhzF family phenazine biosynthesis protein [Fibrella forsythiae]